MRTSANTPTSGKMSTVRGSSFPRIARVPPSGRGAPRADRPRPAMADAEQQWGHTMVLMQFDEARESRTYTDYDAVPAALDGVCQLYEQSLKALNPLLKSITYDVSDLFGYIDSLGDLCCLVFSSQSKAYVPHNRDWIKARLFEHLKSQAIS